MKKRFLSMLLAIVMVVGLVPGFAVTASAATTTLTAWDNTEITLNCNDVLDLSKLSESPTSSTTIVVKGNGVRIIGNPAVTFNNVKVHFVYGTMSDKYTDDTIDISIQDFKVSGQFVLRQYTAPSKVTINYSGDCSFAGGFGDTNDKAPIVYQAAERATLKLTGTQYYFNDVTFEGGTVEAVTVDYGINGSTKYPCNITVKNCVLTFTSLAYTNSSNKPASYAGLSAFGNIHIENSEVVAVHPDQVYSGISSSNIYRLSGIAATGNIDIINSAVTATGVVSSTGAAGNGMYASPAIKSDGEIHISNSTVNAAMRQKTASECTGGDSAAIGGRTCSSIIIDNSTVNAQGYYGAGIGKGGTHDREWGTRVQDYKAVNQTILIEDSTVKAYSYYGAGIGSGWTATNNFTSQSNITIKGYSTVTAGSIYGAGIGSGAQGTPTIWDGVEIIVGGVTVGGWGDGGSGDGEAQNVSRLRTSAASTAPTLSGATNENKLSNDTGSLTIEDSPTIVAESGVKAVSLTVSAPSPMLEYTMTKKNSSDQYVTATPESTVTITRTNNNNKNSYGMRPGYASQAFYPAVSGDYTLTIDGGKLWDVTADTPTLATTFAVSGTTLNSFKVTLPNYYDISVLASDTNGGTVSGGGTYVENSSATVTATANENYVFTGWYKNGSLVSTDVNYTFTVDASCTLTAEFTKHNHQWTYSLETGTTDTIIARCIDGCTTPNGGSVTIFAPTGTLVYNDSNTKTASVSGSFDSATNQSVPVPTYEWKATHGGTYMPYTGTPTGAGYYKASITVENTDGTSAKAYVEYEIIKADQTAPTAPEMASRTATSITLIEQDDCEYSKDGTTWQTSTEFTNLTPAAEYTFYARLVGTNNHNPSPASIGTTISTCINAVNVTLTAPKKNAGPDDASVESGAKYTVSAVTWTPTVTDQFLGETVYTAKFTVSPVSGYAFDPAVAVKVNRETVGFTADGNNLVVTVTFDATQAKAITKFTGVKTAPTAEQTYGDALNPVGLVVNVKYDDGTTGELAYTDATAGQFEFKSDTVLTETVGVRFKGDKGSYLPVALMVNPRPITITANRYDIAYGGSIVSSVDKVTVEGLVNGDILAAITLRASTTSVTANGTITPENAIIRNASDADVNDCYAITYTPGLLTIGLVLDRIEVTAQPKLNYTEGDTLDLSGMVVTAYYTDGSSAPLAYTDVTTSIANGTMLTTNEDGLTITIIYNSKTAATAPLTVQQRKAETDDYWLMMLLMLMNQRYDVTATATDGGAITPAGVTEVKYNQDITYTITPADGYTIADVIVDGESIGAVSVYTFDNVRKDHEIIAIFAEIPWENPYSDISVDDWFYEDVQFVDENGLMNGIVENELFAPELTATRAMIVTILWRLEGKLVVDSPVDFFDVPENEWYTDAINWASANGIVLGYDGLFHPENPITREQLAAILHRYAAYKGIDNGVIFPMIPQYDTSEWAENDVIWADMNGLLAGIGSDMTDMTAEASRAEVAAMLRRFCERFSAE